MIKKSIIAGMLLAGCLQEMAAQNSGQLADRPDYGNVLNYIRVKRYRPADSAFVDTSFVNNIYFSVYGALETPRVKSLSSYHNISPGGGFSIGKQFDKFNSLRLSLAYFRGISQAGPGMMVNSRLDAKADYLFDITSYLMGYHPGRLGSVHTVAGLGLTYIPNGVHRYMPHFQTGLHLRYRAGERLSLYAEPTMMLYPSADNKTSLRNSMLAWSPRLEIGALYNFTAHPLFKQGYKNQNWMDQVFIQGGIGAGLQASFLKGNGSPAKGGTAFVNLGKWYGILGGRLGLFTQAWHNDENKYDRVYGYLGGRADLMLNLNRLFNPLNFQPRVEVNGFLGWEMGAVGYRSNPAYKDRINWFQGPTVGGNLVYYPKPQVGLLLEARYHRPQFDRTLNSGAEQRITQNNISVALGLEIRRRETDFRALKEQYGKDFRPYWFTELSGGVTEGLQAFTPSVISNNIGASGQWTFGRQFTPQSALRFSLGTSKLKSNNGTTAAYPVFVGLDYQLDLLNTLMGYNPERKMDFSLLLGANYLHNAMYEADAIGGHLALQTGVKLGRHVDLVLEPGMKIYRDDVFAGAKQIRNLRAIADAHLGLRYRFEEFNGTFGESARKDFADGLFVRAAAGMNKISAPVSVRPGATASLSLGKWFNFLGLRLTGFGTYTFDGREYPKQADPQKEHTQYVGARLEGMLALADFWKTEEVAPVDVNLIGGWVTGVVRNNSSYNLKNITGMNGYAFSTQVKWNINPHWGIFVEPRFQQLFYHYDKQFTEQSHAVHTVRYKNNMFELEAGVEFQNRGMDNYRQTREHFIPENFVQGEYSVSLPFKLQNRAGLDHRFGVGVGRRFTPLSGARLVLDYGQYDAGVKTPVTTLSADYLFSLKNWFCGYSPESKWQLEAIAGLTYSFSKDALNGDYKPVTGVPGIKLAVRAGYRFLPQWGLYVEPQNLFRFGRLNENFWMYQNRFSETLGLNIGVEYKF